MSVMCRSLRNNKSDIEKELEIRKMVHGNRKIDNRGQIRKIPHKHQLP